MDFAVHIDDKVNIIATLALLLSVINSVAGLISWYRRGPQLRLTANTGMIVVGAAVKDPNMYMSFNVSNVGTAPTTVTNLGIQVYDTWFDFIFRNYRSFLIAHYQGEQVPYLLAIGAKASCHAVQTEEMSKILSKGINFFQVFHSGSKRPAHIRIPLYKPYVGGSKS